MFHLCVSVAVNPVVSFEFQLFDFYFLIFALLCLSPAP